MPYQRNPHFTGRDELLNLLNEKLRDTGAKKYTHRVAIYGMGGVGKTQLAIEYVHRNDAKYDSIFWISSADQAALLSGFQEIARITGCVPNLDENSKPVEVAKAVLMWLRKHDGWLLVMDNMDEIEVAIDYLPEIGKGGHTLITTRNPNHLTIPAEGLQIPVLGKDAAVELLLLRGEITDDSPARKHAAEIVAELGYLAIAIEQAAAFIRSSVDGIDKFLSIYRSSQQRFLRRKLAQSHPYPNSVAATFLLSFNKLDDIDYGSQAIALLRLLAFLNPDGVLVDFLRSGRNGLDDISLRKIVEDDLTFHDALELLRRYSLVEVTQRRDYVVIHRLVQALIKDVMSEAERWTFRENVVSLCESGLPAYDDDDDDVENMTPPQRMEWRRLQSQILEPLIEAAAELNSERVSTVLLLVGRVLDNEGKYQDSERVFRITVGIRAKLLGEEAPQTLESLAGLAKVLWRREKLEEAATIDGKILEAMTRTLGKEHSETLDVMGDLSLILWSQGNVKQAVVIEEEIVDTKIRILGEEHRGTLRSMANLAEFLRTLGKLERAAALQEKILEVRLRTLGEKHVDTLSDTANLALTYCDQGKLEQAAAMLEKVLKSTLDIYGEDHPVPFAVMDNLAWTLRRQGKLEQAKVMYEKVVKGTLKAFGEEHSHTLNAMRSLSWTLEDLAESLGEKVLEATTRTLGEEHVNTMLSMEFFSRILWNRDKRLDEVLAMEEKVLEGRVRIFGEEHPDTLRAMNILAVSYYSLGRRQEALELMHKAVEGSRKHLGDHHPDTLRRVDNFKQMIGTSTPPLRNLSDGPQRSKKPARNDSFWFRI
jgi:tetratricopeptide (TPR) repeat protein